MQAKRIVITGISDGIGKAAALRLVDQGHYVYGNVRTNHDRERLLGQLEREQAQRLNIYACDLNRKNEIRNWLSSVLKPIDVDVLINNAAIAIAKPFGKVTIREWESVMRINVTASFIIAQWAFNKMKKKKKGGAIIQISSLASVPYLEKFSGLIPYTVSKYAVAGLSENIAFEGRPYGIQSVCLSPGAVDTKMLQLIEREFPAALQPEQVAEQLCEMVNHFMPVFNGMNMLVRP